VSLDPGGMSGTSRLGELHWFLSIAKPVLQIIAPVVRMIDPSAINPPEVPAKHIAELFVNEGKAEGNVAGKYFILGKESIPSSTSLDVAQQQVIWDQVLSDLKLNAANLNV
jgi:hypothetical protein